MTSTADHVDAADAAAEEDRSHPLDQLSSDEISAAVSIVRTHERWNDGVVFSSVTLSEPAKDVVRSFLPGQPIERRAFIVGYDRPTRELIEATVSITGGVVEALGVVEGANPPFLLDDALTVRSCLVEDPGFIDAMAKRGITDFTNIQFDPWPAGNFDLPVDQTGRRFYRVMTYLRDDALDNGYAHPVENLVVFFDADAKEVVEILDTGVIPVPTPQVNYTLDAMTAAGTEMQTLAPLDIVQPDGPGFSMHGSQLCWQKWQMRVSMDPVEGLVLHEIGWRDGSTVRPILYRANLGEMVVPYGSGATNQWWKNAFDAGEVGLGKMTNSLTLGCDCLGEILYLDATFVAPNGEPYSVPNAICIHEEDYGILWKHTDFETGHVEVRRSRRLVVSSIATVGNYEYGFYWYFYLDGSIEHEIKMTGILQTQALLDDEQPVSAVRLGPNLAAPHHQHLFCFRLDFEVDGASNTVSEVDVVSLPEGDDNPAGNGFDTVTTRFETEHDAQRNIDAAASRTWIIESTETRNALGSPTAFRLMPGSTPTMLARPSSSVHSRATFGTRNLWVTPFEPSERHPAGDYPSQHPGGDGLARWTQADRSIENTDVVVWHTFGASHIARPEDWPVMPVETLGFMLKPSGFFDRNPALDVPPSSAACCD